MLGDCKHCGKYINSVGHDCRSRRIQQITDYVANVRAKMDDFDVSTDVIYPPTGAAIIEHIKQILND